MRSDLIYLDISQEIEESEIWKKLYAQLLDSIPQDYDQTIYIFQKPMLVSEDKEYYKMGITLVIQNTSIISVNCSSNTNDKELFEEYCDDIIDDINSLASEKYPQYFKLLGRKRKWMKLFKVYNYDEVEEIQFFNLSTKSESRKIKILSSLIIGSINDFDNFDVDILEKLKKEHPEYIVDMDIKPVGDHEVVDSSTRYGYCLMKAKDLGYLYPYLPDNGEE